MTRVTAILLTCLQAVGLIVLASPWLVAQQSERKLVPFDGAEEDHFGLSVAISGDFLIVGSPQDDDNGMNSGSAYLFRWDGADWLLDRKLSASDGASQDLFGSAVDIAGDRAIVGAPGMGSDRGAAFVFRSNGLSWTEEAMLTPDDGAEGDLFGSSVALEDTLTIVGAPGHQSAAGSAYVFGRIDTSWSEVARLVADDGVLLDYFGVSTALSGNRAIIGARGDDDMGLNSGSAYVFRGDGTIWSQDAKLLAADGASDDNFGFSVSISGMFALIGAFGEDDDGMASGSAYVFYRDGTDWIQQTKLRASDAASADFFGYAVEIHAGSAIVGSPFDDDRGGSSGSAYLFRLDGTNWIESRKLAASDGSESDHFGRAVAIGDGFAVAGAPDDDIAGSNSGSVYAYGSGATSAGHASNTPPEDIPLLQNYPNPFNASTEISYALPSESRVKLEVFNTLGQRVSLLVDDVKQPGVHSARWNGTHASGLYFYRIEATALDNPANHFAEVKKMLYLK